MDAYAPCAAVAAGRQVSADRTATLVPIGLDGSPAQRIERAERVQDAIAGAGPRADVPARPVELVAARSALTRDRPDKSDGRRSEPRQIIQRFMRRRP